MTDEKTNEKTEPTAPPPSVAERYSTDWRDFPWPKNVPREVREEVEIRWGPKFGRNPRQYVADFEDREPPMPHNGDKVADFPVLPLTKRETASGVYVHAYGRIGFVLGRGRKVTRVQVPLTYTRD